MKKLIPVLFVLLTSCELLVDVKVPYDGDKPVINAIQSLDSVWTIGLTRSRYILAPYNRPGAPFFPIDFAKVSIVKPDGSTEELQLKKSGTGKFIGTTFPEPRKTYKISVTPTGLEPVEAVVTMPPRVPMINVEWDSTAVPQPSGPNEFVSFNLPFKVSFSDPANEKNFYAIEVYQTELYVYTDSRTGVTTYDTTFRELSPRITDPGIALKNDSRQWFSDEIFDGKTYTAPMSVNLYYFNSRYQTIELQVRLVSMSAEYFKYMETMELSFEVDGDPFAQPVQIYSNTSNGFGIFAGAAHDVKVFKTYRTD